MAISTILILDTGGIVPLGLSHDVVEIYWCTESQDIWRVRLIISCDGNKHLFSREDILHYFRELVLIGHKSEYEILSAYQTYIVLQVPYLCLLILWDWLEVSWLKIKFGQLTDHKFVSVKTLD